MIHTRTRIYTLHETARTGREQDNKLIENSAGELLEKRKSKDDSSFGVKQRNSFKSKNPGQDSPTRVSKNSSPNSSRNSSSNNSHSPNHQRYIYSTHTASKYSAIQDLYENKKQCTELKNMKKLDIFPEWHA